VKKEIILPEEDDKKLWDVIAGLVGYLAVPIAFELDLFTTLDESPKTNKEVADILGIEERPAEAIALACLTLGFLSLNDSKYELTNVAKTYLVKSSPFYFGATFNLIINNYMGYKEIKEAVLTNKPVAYGESDIFATHEEQNELAKNFTRFMHSASMAPALSWPDKIDLSNHTNLLDIGGGSGAHTVGALLRWENLMGTVFEIGPVTEVCDEVFEEHGLKSRASSSVGNFWETEFPLADVHFYSQIFHDWPIEKCSFLASKSYESMPVGGKIIIHEMLMNDNKSGPFMASAGNIAMLAWTEGKQYSGKELENLLVDAGFKDIQVIPTFGYWSIVVGSKN
jgi:hypothetical protein